MAWISALSLDSSLVDLAVLSDNSKLSELNVPFQEVNLVEILLKAFL